MKKILFITYVAGVFALTSTPALADSIFRSHMAKSTFCQGLYKIGRSTVREKAKGTDEDEIFRRLEEVLAELDNYGYEMKHLTRTTVKGAVVTDMTASEYGLMVQSECMKLPND